jgi:hypothetical protein
MADLLQSASQWLDRQRKAFASQTVTYRRGAFSVSVQATIGRSVFEVEEASGVVQQVESRDYLITPADLVLNSATVEPQAGDTIEETTGGRTRTYKCLPFGTEKPWRYSDPYRATFRVHTKLMSET